MKSETEPITDDEWLLRRVRVEMFRTDRIPIISPRAFEPRMQGRNPDTGGISLYRAACLADLSEVLATVSPERQHEYGIVRLKVSVLKSLGLSIRSEPDERVKGHVVIPELNADDYKNDKARLKPITVELATQASHEENILRRPNVG